MFFFNTKVYPLSKFFSTDSCLRKYITGSKGEKYKVRNGRQPGKSILKTADSQKKHMR